MIKLTLDWLANYDDWLLIVENSDNGDNLAHVNLVAKYFSFSSRVFMLITTQTQAPG